MNIKGNYKANLKGAKKENPKYSIHKGLYFLKANTGKNSFIAVMQA